MKRCELAPTTLSRAGPASEPSEAPARYLESWAAANRFEVARRGALLPPKDVGRRRLAASGRRRLSTAASGRTRGGDKHHGVRRGVLHSEPRTASSRATASATRLPMVPSPCKIRMSGNGGASQSVDDVEGESERICGGLPDAGGGARALCAVTPVALRARVKRGPSARLRFRADADADDAATA